MRHSMVFARVGPIVALSALLGGCQPVVQQSPGITAAEPCKVSAEAEFLNSFTTYHLNYPQALRGCPLTWKDNNFPAVGVNVVLRGRCSRLSASNCFSAIPYPVITRTLRVRQSGPPLVHDSTSGPYLVGSTSVPEDQRVYYDRTLTIMRQPRDSGVIRDSLWVNAPVLNAGGTHVIFPSAWAMINGAQSSGSHVVQGSIAPLVGVATSYSLHTQWDSAGYVYSWRAAGAEVASSRTLSHAFYGPTDLAAIVSRTGDRVADTVTVSIQPTLRLFVYGPTQVSSSADLTWSFGSVIVPETMVSATWLVTDASGNPLANGTGATFSPSIDLSQLQQFTVTVSGTSPGYTAGLASLTVDVGGGGCCASARAGTSKRSSSDRRQKTGKSGG